MKCTTTYGTYTVEDQQTVIICGIDCIPVINESPDEFDSEHMFIPTSQIIYFS